MISAGIIARNEQDVIGRAISSLKGVADETVVCDTGSDDNTVSIARENGCKVVHFPWVDDFSQARNYCHSQCTGDWVITLDSDEVLLGDRAEIRNEILSLHDTVGIVRIPVQYANTSFEFLSNRVCRRETGKWFGACHEYLTATGTLYELRSGKIIHDKPAERRENGTDRNIRILTRALKEEPDNPRYLFYMAREQKNAGRYSDAINYYTRYIPISNFPGEEYRAYIDRADCFIVLSEYARARSSALDSVCLFPDAIDGYIMLSAISYRENDWVACAMWARCALAVKGNRHVLFGSSDRFRAYDYLSVALWNLGKYDEGFEIVKCAVDLRPGDERVRTNMKYFAEKVKA